MEDFLPKDERTLDGVFTCEDFGKAAQAVPRAQAFRGPFAGDAVDGELHRLLQGDES